MTRADAVAVVQGTIAALSATGITIRPEAEKAATEAAIAAAETSPNNTTAVVNAISAALLPAVQAAKARKAAFDDRQTQTAERATRIAGVVTLVVDKINADPVIR